MKLAERFSLAVVATICLVLAGHGAFRWHREAAMFRADVVRDHNLVGNGIALATAEVWEDQGETAALELVRDVNLRKDGLEIRAVRLDPDAAAEFRPAAPPATPHPPASTSFVVDDGEGPAVLVTWVPLEVPDPGAWAVELREPLAREERYRRTSILIIAATTLLTAGLAAGATILLGRWFVGVPVARLIDQVRRIAAGDLSGRLGVASGDELGSLAREVNRMADHLEETRQRLAEEARERRAAVDQLRHANRLINVGRLASGVAHDAGTPLNVIAARAHLVATEALTPEETRENARIVEEQAGRITGMLRRMLDFARPGALARETLDLATLARQTAEMLAPLARRHQARLELDVAEGLRVLGDPRQLQQVLTNLVMNALQAMPRGGRVLLITREEIVPDLRGGTPRPVATLAVADEGTGIAEAHLSRLFEPFFTTKQEGQGTGLGLSVARGIVEEHGGWITVGNRSEGGACFRVHLPREGSS